MQFVSDTSPDKQVEKGLHAVVLSNQLQWRIQDFPQGKMCAKMKELGPIGGRAPGTPPRSTSELYVFICVTFPSRWRIPDFPLGGANPTGESPMSDVGAFQWKHVQNELGPIAPPLDPPLTLYLSYLFTWVRAQIIPRNNYSPLKSFCSSFRLIKLNGSS